MTDSLLHRWSKQKSQTESQSEPEVADQEQASEMQDTTDAVLAEPTSEAPTETVEPDDKEPVELPPIESLDEDSDYSLFMSPEVDEGLRKLALRKLFKSPMFNVVDGLNDYDDDFTTFEALGDIVTSDMKFHEERKKAEQALREEQSVEPAEITEDEDAEPVAQDSAPDGDQTEVTEEQPDQSDNSTNELDSDSETDEPESPPA